MNKSDLVDAIADKANLSKADAGRALDATIQAVTRALKKGDTVSLVGFGTFTVRKRAARTGANRAISSGLTRGSCPIPLLLAKSARHR